MDSMPQRNLSIGIAKILSLIGHAGVNFERPFRPAWVRNVGPGQMSGPPVAHGDELRFWSGPYKQAR